MANVSSNPAGEDAGSDVVAVMHHVQGSVTAAMAAVRAADEEDGIFDPYMPCCCLCGEYHYGGCG